MRVLLLHILFFISCKNLPDTGIKPAVIHECTVKNYDGSEISIDRISSSSIIKRIDFNKDTFYSYKIVFIDSTLKNKKDEEEYQKYLNYEMPNHWCALISGDSSRPVFYQPLPKKNFYLNEGIMVFESNQKHSPDTLIYRDKFRSNMNVFVLKFANQHL